MRHGLRSTGERSVPTDLSTLDEHLLHLRQLFAYRLAEQHLAAAERILDAGTGEGYGTSLLATGMRRVVGVEVDPETVLHAARKYGSCRCSFALYDGVTLPFADRAFDAAVSFQVIEHVADDDAFTMELARVLRPGGLALLTTPNRHLRLRPGERPWNRFHRREYSASELGSLLRGAFSEVEVLGIDAAPDVKSLELARLRRIRTLVAIDPLRLHRRLPRPVANGLRRLLHRLSAGIRSQRQPRAAVGYGVDDFSLVASSVEAALDLVAVCRRGELRP